MIYAKGKPRTAALRVRSAEKDDVYGDIIRLGKRDRQGLKTGRVHIFEVGGRQRFAILRGLSPAKAGFIAMDADTRADLGINGRHPHYDFRITQANWIGELRWALTAVNPGYRMSARLAVLSVVLGATSLLPLLQGSLEKVGSFALHLTAQLKALAECL
ncbi:MAG TPA: hypothetical protein VFX95_03690 [Caulobacteraceae bacterium]|nr:hypothetical protein [Caulobacteraceae bacterium]